MRTLLTGLLAAVALLAQGQVISVPTGRAADEERTETSDGHVTTETPGTRVIRENGRVKAIEMSGKALNSAKPATGSGSLRLASGPAKSSDQPREFEGTFGELTLLDRLRASALAAEKRAARASVALPVLQAGQRQLEAQLAAKNTELAAANPKIWRNKYNALLKEVNDLKGRLDANKAAVGAEERALAAAAPAAETYLNRVRQFEADFTARRNAFLASNEVTRAEAYLGRVEERSARHRKAVFKDRPEHEKYGDHLVFRAFSGGKGPVKLMLDTGATHVVMNLEAAKRLGLKTSGTPTKLQIGNGTTLEGELVIAPELKVGESVATRVSVVVTAVTDKMDGMDGVLGMSFLNQFRMEYNPAAGTLELGALRLSGD